MGNAPTSQQPAETEWQLLSLNKTAPSITPVPTTLMPFKISTHYLRLWWLLQRNNSSARQDLF